ncbi:conserved hypothetical protein [Leishmania infantum JPCM5]|uniref:Uncharacterized protein n=2 Tax=Leishmania infantum TaxID=5671 RepID=A4HX99_LEIIN|nr:conserved hypothetical protein [Leishmania infantum JPCM5]CAC9477510.1 hypothetical_protein_-_conserved [Leishmania infantum]CAM59718.1 conserved hypothetical protein [Leishmania infantum JPCM5]SUZ40800.1 hypothetical_protein_-_conserved [Leishmania infantum]|eukprot:XP_001464690.1 conserved hypothetical protein [Leishmania infantum JPCM5]
MMGGRRGPPLDARPQALFAYAQTVTDTPMPRWQPPQTAAMGAGDKGSCHATPLTKAGASRFNVVFRRSSGSRQQRAKREGALSVAHDVSYLYDKDNRECVLRCKAVGQAPNKIFMCMQLAHRGADWVVGTELNLCGFDILVEEVMELHCIPYEEAVDAADNSSEAGAGGDLITCCGTSAHTASAASYAQTLSTAASVDPGRGHTTHAQPRFSFLPRQTSQHFVTTTPSRATRDNGPSSPTPLEDEEAPSICAPQKWPTLKMDSVSVGTALTAHHPTDLPPPAPRDERGVDGSVCQNSCPPHERRQRRRRRSVASLARELERCYPEYF